MKQLLFNRIQKVSQNLTSKRFFCKEDALVDTFGRFHNYLRISLTEKCNLRCVYCMPEEGVDLSPENELLSLDERKRAIQIFSRLGVNKLRFTGGEPTISMQLNELVHFSKFQIPNPISNIGITSNGLVLKKKLPDLVSSGLTSVNISLDTLSDEKYGSITRRDPKSLYRVMSSIYSAVNAGLNVKINCVLMRGLNDDEIHQFIQLTKDVNLDCRFIELMPFDGNQWSDDKYISYFEVLDQLREKHNIKMSRDSVELQNGKMINKDPNDTTKWYRVDSSYLGRVGFITSMSSPFCGTCNRLRLTADGKIKVCLFGADGFSLRDAFREGCSDDEVINRISEAVQLKKAALGGYSSPEGIAARSDKNRPMILIGG